MENNNVNVYLRVRPTQIWEHNSPAKSYMDFNTSTDKMLILETNPYIFDHIFYSNSTQSEVFQKIEPCVENLLKGFKSCIFAYGQSGAGKTFTMGLNEKNTAGMITLSLDLLFKTLGALNESGDGIEFEVSISYIEIYNEKVYDLLDDKTESIHTKGSKYAGSIKFAIKSSSDAKEILAKANKNRHTRSTTLNASSSRSHAMFSVFLNMHTANGRIGSVLHLVDLAGSEGLRNTGHKGIAQQEGIHINQGLLAVGKVIQALSTGKKLIPYRDSILTTVLQDCLNSNAFLTLIACISPGRKDRNETISTIRFAQSCKALENKMIPEMNAYLKHKQKLQARTPLKPYMLPVSRNELVKTPGKTLAKTPSKNAATINRGTVKKPQPVASVNRFHSFNTPSKRLADANPTRHSAFPQTTNMIYLNPTPKQSIDNNTFNILNFSSSTEVEGPSNSAYHSTSNLAQVPSFSPLMRQIEAAIDKKLTSFMSSFINQTTSSTINENINENLRNDIKDAVVSGINEIRNLTGADDSNMHNSTFVEVPENAVSSTVMRQPVVPSIRINDETIPAKRTNRRLMTDDLLEHDNLSLRASSSGQDITSQNLTIAPAPCRRSVRISMMEDIRKSKTNSTPAIVSKTRKTKIKNQIMATYMNRSASSLQQISKDDHKAAVMDIINTGSVKELRMLPTIGSKTAYQIVSYRLVKGKFATLEAVKKALMMKDKAWNNFMEKNLLKG